MSRADLASIIAQTCVIAMLLFIVLVRDRVSARTNNLTLITLLTITATAMLMCGDPVNTAVGVGLFGLVGWGAWTERRRAAREKKPQ